MGPAIILVVACVHDATAVETAACMSVLCGRSQNFVCTSLNFSHPQQKRRLLNGVLRFRERRDATEAGQDSEPELRRGRCLVRRVRCGWRSLRHATFGFTSTTTISHSLLYASDACIQA